MSDKRINDTIVGELSAVELTSPDGCSTVVVTHFGAHIVSYKKNSKEIIFKSSKAILNVTI
jgi:D-hexose-6-phosphate mutarotase